MDQSEGHVVRTVGTVAAGAGFAWLVLLRDSGYHEWRFLAAALLLGGLLLRIESAILRSRSDRLGPKD